jgi:ABC-2 type transport system permease protein
VKIRFSTLVTYIAFQFRSELRATIYWTIGLSIYVGAVVSLYPSVKSALNIEAIPAGMRSAFNITDFTYLAGFLSSELFGVILPLVLPFYGIVMLSNVVAGAEERGRLDILLGNPLPRYQLVVGTFIVAATYLLAMVMTFGGVIWLVAGAFDLSLTARQAFRATFALWPTALVFSTLALAVSTRARQRAVAMGIPAAIVLLSYLILVIGRLSPAVEIVKYVSAYNYYGVAILEGIWWEGTALLLTATAALLTFAIVSFNRRDIYA